MNTSGDKYTDAFDHHRSDYSFFMTLANEFFLPQIREIITKHINQGNCVLDAGCGDGFVTLELAKRVGAHGKVVGVDLSGAHIAKALDRASSSSFAERIALKRCSLYSLPFSSESFDTVWLSNALSHLRDTISAFSELRRVLRPNGHIVIVQSELLGHLMLPSLRALEIEVEAEWWKLHLSMLKPNQYPYSNLRSIISRSNFSDLNIAAYPVVKIPPLTENEAKFLEQFFILRYVDQEILHRLPATARQKIIDLADPNSKQHFLKRDDFFYLTLITVATGVL